MSSTVQAELEHEVRSRRGTPTWEIAHLFPEQGEWTEAQYLSLDTNRLIEFKDGYLEFLPMPTTPHHFILRFLFLHFHEFVASRTLGEVLFAPLRVRIRKGLYREPDLLFLKPDRLKGDLKKPLRGADLVIEIVSEGEENRRRDLEEKRHDYAQAGIPEYWIVDPERQTITVLVLEGQAYRVGEFGPGRTADSVLLSGFHVEVSAVFAAGQAGATPQDK